MSIRFMDTKLDALARSQRLSILAFAAPFVLFGLRLFDHSYGSVVSIVSSLVIIVVGPLVQLFALWRMTTVLKARLWFIVFVTGIIIVVVILIIAVVGGTVAFQSVAASQSLVEYADLFVPISLLLSVIALVVIHIKATRRLRAAGYHVGILGAKPRHDD